jgi:4-diphosphocytidyl-2-C-methyl-D-erythritol kinase
VLEVITDENLVDNDHIFSQSGLSAGDNSENICVKAFQLLKKDFPSIPAIQMHLHKTIPIGAGLGGGSADAAFTLIALNKMAALNLSADRLSSYALQLGSDCPFFILNKPCYATGRGEITNTVELDLSSYMIMLVNPGIHIHTAEMFRKIKPEVPSDSLRQIISTPVAKWRNTLKNDFEPLIIEQYPEIGEIKNKLYGCGALYAAMSGSGSTVYAIFDREFVNEVEFPQHYLVKKLVGQL